MIYQNILLEVPNRSNWEYQLKKDAIHFLTAYFINTIFISKVNSTFLSAEELKLLLWMVLICYLYSWLKSNITISNPENQKNYFIKTKNIS